MQIEGGKGGPNSVKCCNKVTRQLSNEYCSSSLVRVNLVGLVGTKARLQWVKISKGM